MNVGSFLIRCYANLSSDLDRNNDTLSHNFTAVVGKDAFPNDIILSVDSANFDLSDTLYEVKVAIENQGADTIKKVLVNVSIFEKGVRTAFNSKVTQLSGKAKDTLLFDLNHTFTELGKAELLVYTSSFEDQNIFNDSVWANINVQLLKDASILKAIQPGTGSKLIKNDSIRFPEILCSNMGKVRATGANQIVYQILQPASGTLIFSDTLKLPSLNPGDSLWVKSLKTLNFNEAGTYLLRSYFKNSLDGVRQNDSLQYVLFVEEPLNSEDLSIFFDVFPNPVHSGLTVQSASIQEPVTVSLLDASGRIVFTETAQKEVITIPVAHLSAGFYTIQLQTRYHTQNRSIVIEHP